MPLSGSTVFSIKQDENVYVGNNEDGSNPNPRYRIIPGTEEVYGRIVFSFENNWAQGGMNEKGFFFDWIFESEESTTWKKDPLKKDYKGNLSAKILAECATVEEALKYYEAYNEPRFKTSFTVLVDSSGQSAFVYWEDNQLIIKKCKGLCVWGFGGEKVVKECKKNKGSMNQKQMIHLLNVAHQKGEYPTLYSNLYDLKKGLIYLYYYHNYGEEIVLDLQEELKKGKHNVELKDIFKTQIPEKEKEQLQMNYLKEEVKSIPLKGWLVLGVFGSVLLFIISVLYFLFQKKDS